MSTLTADIRKAVAATVAAHFRIRLQQVYAGLQQELGITGDISPWEDFALSNAEADLADVVGTWLVNNLSFDQAEAIGMDGTRRDGA